MLAMQYKGFVWPNNPSNCRLELRRTTVTHPFPGGGYQLEELGEYRRVLTGQGEFFGPFAYTYMDGLIQIYELGGEGELVHPVVEMPRAYLTELTFLEEPRENYVAYSFTFEEDGGLPEEKGSTGVKVHTTEGWESLWDVAERYETDVETLLTLNPWVEHPNRLPVGRQVILP